MRLLLAVALAMASTIQAHALEPRPGWAVHPTAMAFADLLARTKDAVKAQKMFVVTEAGPTEAAARRGEIIPDNRVLGVFRNDFAVRMLRADTAAMIEAPIRLYLTEDESGAATLSYKLPSFVFEPYLEDAGAEGQAVAGELDAIFAAIAAQATAR